MKKAIGSTLLISKCGDCPFKHFNGNVGYAKCKLLDDRNVYACRLDNQHYHLNVRENCPLKQEKIIIQLSKQ